MSTHKNLITLCFAAVLALGLSACGGGGGGGGGDAPVTGMMDGDGSLEGKFILSGEMIPVEDVADGTTIPIESEAELPLDGVGTVRCVSDEGCLLTVKEGTLTIMGNLQIVIVDPDLDDATEMLLAELVVDKLPTTPPVAGLAALDGGAVAAAIGRGTGDTTEDFQEVAGGVVKKADDDMGDEYAKSDTHAPAAIDGWAGALYTRTMEDDAETMEDDESSTTMVVSYTNIDDPTPDEYQIYYTQSTASDRDGIATIDDAVTGNVIKFVDGDVSAISMHFDGDALPEGSNIFVIFVDDEDTTDTNERMFEGMFHGVPGTFACTDVAECRAENNADGDLAKLLGTWTFTPKEQEMGDDAYMVAGVVADTDYLDFGYWIVTKQGEDGPVYTVGTYANGAPDSNYGPTASVVGTAKYAGPAAGVYMTKTFDANSGDPIPGAAGYFTARAMLIATFGQTGEDHPDGLESIAPGLLNTVTGTVMNFRNSAGEMIDEDWEVELMKSEMIAADGTFTGATTGMGSYSGTFHGDDPGTENEHPGAVTGTFDAHLSNGHVAGGFGATLVTEDE